MFCDYRGNANVAPKDKTKASFTYEDTLTVYRSKNVALITGEGEGRIR